MKWTIEFDGVGLSADDVRMISAVVKADVCLIRFAHPNPAEDELAAERALFALSAKFPKLIFRVVKDGVDDG